MSWLVDAHVHYHRCFGWESFLAGVLENLQRAREGGRGFRSSAVCLLFANRGTENDPSRLREAPPDEIAPPWTVQNTHEENSIVLRHGEDRPVFVIDGRQIVTRERLEVLALASSHSIPDGLSLREAVEAALDAGAVTVLPWGFGKWWLGRGRAVRRLLEDGVTGRIYMGDNGNRPAVGPTPVPFRIAEERGIPVLPGSDPLPFPHHAQRAGSYGFELSGALDPERPGASVRRALRELSASPPAVGGLRGLGGFVVDQVRMQAPGGTRGMCRWWSTREAR